jgi:hypothetical protein
MPAIVDDLLIGGAAVAGFVVGGVLGWLIFKRSQPKPSGIKLQFTTAPNSGQNGSWSQPPFVLTVTAPPGVSVASREVIFTIVALNPPPNRIADIVQASVASTPLHSIASTPIYTGITSPAGTISLVIQPDGIGTARIVATDIAGNETTYTDYTSNP